MIYDIFSRLNWDFIKWVLLGLVVIFILFKVIKRGYFWKVKKTGEKLTVKQFFKLWGRGIEGITPLQQSKSQLTGNWIVLIGITSGIVVNCLIRLKDTWWWLTIILTGSLILSAIQQINFYQQYKVKKKVDETVKSLKK